MTFGLQHCPMHLDEEPSSARDRGCPKRLGTGRSIALLGVTMPDSVLQGVANLVAIGLERARAQDLAQQIEAARQVKAESEAD